jgi:sRNA-binding carbon storage regulator CsrA
MHRHTAPKHRAEDYRREPSRTTGYAGPGRPGLSLSRNDRQEIRIYTPAGEQIVITLLESRWGRARLHIAAPLDMKILRGELDAMQQMRA